MRFRTVLLGILYVLMLPVMALSGGTMSGYDKGGKKLGRRR